MTVILDQIEAAIYDVDRKANCWSLGGIQGGCWSVRVNPTGEITSDVEAGSGSISAAEFDDRTPRQVTVFQQVINPAFVGGAEYDEFRGDGPLEIDREEIRRDLERAGFEVI